MSAKGAALAAVTGIGPVSRPAIGVEELCAVPESAWHGPGDGTRELDNFEPSRFLGKRGWKFMPPATRMALAAVRLALADAGPAPERPADRTGVVLGTNFAVSEIVDRIDRALLAGGIGGISPVESPNFAVNVPVGQVSIAHGLKAFNITLVDLVTAGYASLLLGARALAGNRADAVLTGAVEGPPPTAFLTHSGHGADAGGACLLYLEDPAAARRRDARVHALLTGGVRRMLPDDPQGAERVLGPALDRLTAAEPDRLHLCVPAGHVGRYVEESVRKWAASRGVPGDVEVVRGAPQASVTGVLALARRLARQPGDGEGNGLLCVAVGPYGNLVALRFHRGGGAM
ncbi:beta-ketoacyl synthase N-terminal-like domain-containing protein [Streptomyces mobaraensis]|uniref:beta-ketoacyl synthase N-terminal-like domain-containing protein n=1 Tax=Streptomyces mobaraensis TaxID=35621 RepID=UPI001CCDA3E0|nr:beta-ketoacyl synthase N-terminal-like domain-containing protein [Streptomyces mobaraensis]UBI37608.1 hypothetical protein K7I03_14780 [Streptomyces mobaraensis]